MATRADHYACDITACIHAHCGRAVVPSIIAWSNLLTFAHQMGYLGRQNAHRRKEQADGRYCCTPIQ